MKSMFVRTMAASAVAAIVAGADWAQSQDGVVKELTVNSEYTALKDSNAQEYFPTLATDLMTSIADKIAMTTEDAGYVVEVNLQEVRMDDSAMLPESREFNQMDGVVSITSPQADAGAESYPVKIVAMDPAGTVPEGYIAVSPSSDDFYRAMIEGYANAVVDVLPEDIPNSVAK